MMRAIVFAMMATGLLLAGPAWGQSYPDVAVDMTLEQVSEHCYYVRGASGPATENKGFISNAGFIVTSEGVVLIDALGTPSLAQKLRGLIREVTDQPVVQVVMTHYHADHIYGLQVFTEEGAEVIAPQGSLAYLNLETTPALLEERRLLLAPWVDDNTRLVEPDRIITEQTTLQHGDIRLTLIPMGAAHSEGDMAIYVEPDRVLYSGDIIFEGRVPYVGSADSKAWLEALQGLEGRELAVLVPGHGPVAEDPNQALSLTRRYLAFVREQMGAAVEEMTPFDQAYEQVDWSEFEDLPAFEAANRLNAYQVYLNREAEQFE